MTTGAYFTSRACCRSCCQPPSLIIKMQPPRPSFDSLRRTALPYLTVLSHVPTPFISAFIVIHLSAPIVANVGGSSLSSQVMVSPIAIEERMYLDALQLLGREYYQTSLGEPLFLWAPLGLHVAASLSKRLCSPKPFERPSSLLSIAAYSSLVLIPLHALVNRIYPTLTVSPIDSLGPSELDYEFVKYGIQQWPIRSTVFYALLTGFALMHMVEGAGVIYKRWVSPMHGPWSKRSTRTRRLLGMTGAVAALSGVLTSAAEPIVGLTSVLHRYRVVYEYSIFYRLWT